MGIGSSVSSSIQNKTGNQATVNKSQQYLTLDFQYTDRTQYVQIEDRMRFLSTDTISSIATEFLELDELSTVSPNHINLIAISLGGNCAIVHKQKSSKTLEELKIKNGSLLCFEPSKLENRCSLSQLILFSPHDNSRRNYQWNEKSTTLNMLLDYVIEIFSLYAVDSSSIQLCTFWNENLNRLHNSEKKLKDLNLTEYSSIFVTIKNIKTSYVYDQDTYVHVKSNLHGEILFYASTMDSFLELKRQIERRFPRYYFTGVEFVDPQSSCFIKKNLNRKLRELDIKTNDTINAIVKDYLKEKQMRTTNRRMEKLQSPLLNTKEHLVIIQLQVSMKEIIHIEVSSEDSVIEAMKKIEGYIKNKSKTKIRLYSDSISIDDMQSDRSLADFGIQPGSTMYASMSGVDKENQTSLKPFGLRNLGNTCFMNSALQCLFHVVPLTDFFLDGFVRIHDSNINSDGYNPFDSCGEMTEAYAELICNIRIDDYTNSDNNRSLEPIRMKEIIGYFAPNFATSDQQDAQEFITFLLDVMHEELKVATNSDSMTVVQRLFFGILQSKITCLECNHITITTNRISFLPLSLSYPQRTFKVNFLTKDGTHDRTMVSVNVHGTVENLVQTVLEHHQLVDLIHRIIVIGAKSEEQLEFNTLLKLLSEDEVTLIEQDIYIVPIESNRSDVECGALSLQECLEGFISVERLEDLWLCEQQKCQRKTHVTKQLSFKNLPHVIIIQLKRFSCKNGLRQKLDTYVDYPINGLDLSGLLSESSSPLEKENAIYDLIAVSNHRGSIHSGHYTACARKDSSMDKWYEFDDTHVSIVLSEHKIISKDAYLLFYMKQTK